MRAEFSVYYPYVFSTLVVTVAGESAREAERVSTDEVFSISRRIKVTNRRSYCSLIVCYRKAVS